MSAAVSSQCLQRDGMNVVSVESEQGEMAGNEDAAGTLSRMNMASGKMWNGGEREGRGERRGEERRRGWGECD